MLELRVVAVVLEPLEVTAETTLVAMVGLELPQLLQGHQ
jgi:hypothetical protein